MDMNQEETKEVVKEAIKEWMNENIRTFGWWSLKTIGALAFAGIIYLSFIGTGHFR